MGLCKCPRRKVTNQFCFEHRVNVCEYCLTSTHTKCVVKSYLHWLQDSDFNPICTLCGEGLANGDCLRLTCYDVFHWDCINKEALKLPKDSGFACHICKSSLFPSGKLVSPVADAVREKLSTVGWGRKGLGLPSQIAVQEQSQRHTTGMQIGRSEQQKENSPSVSYVTNQMLKTESIASSNLSSTAAKSKINSAPLQTSSSSDFSQTAHVREKFQVEVPSKVFDTREEEKIDVFDHDEDKYRRKGIRRWLTKISGLRRKGKYARDDPNITFKRVSVLMVLIVLGFMTAILILTRVGRGMNENDRSLDPRSNPHIRVHDNVVHQR